jgi:hypothetical protein
MKIGSFRFIVVWCSVLIAKQRAKCSLVVMRVVVGVEEVYLSRGVVILDGSDGSGLFCRGRVFIFA